MIKIFELTHSTTPLGEGVNPYIATERFETYEECVAFVDKKNAEMAEWQKKNGYEVSEPIHAVEKIEEIELRFANELGYSDVTPFEITRYISDKTLEIREMDAELLNADELKFHVGGFAGHCSNQRVQKYSYATNENGRTYRIRKNKKGEWVYKSLRFSLNNKPQKFYDYNF